MKSINLIAVATSLLLTACGGGGGGSTSTTNTTYTSTCSDGTTQVSTVSQTEADRLCTVATAPQPSTIVTSVPTDTYNAVTQAEEKAAFALLNAERSACGFGKLAQNTLLDTAARGHADWLLRNNYTGHYQVAGTPGFTGVNPVDRGIAAGYSPSGYNENAVNDFVGGNDKTNDGVYSTRGLFSAPYHAINALAGWSEVGLAIRSKGDLGITGLGSTYINMDFAYSSSKPQQLINSTETLTYPCQGTTGVAFSLTGETPNPVPGRNLASSPVGHPIILMARSGRTISIASSSLTKISTGAAVPLRPAVTNATDPNGSGYYGSNFAYILPDVALEPSTQYQVNITGNHGTGPLNRTVFSRSFTFTTGSVNY